jgi:hypothetical protein
MGILLSKLINREFGAARNVFRGRVYDGGLLTWSSQTRPISGVGGAVAVGPCEVPEVCLAYELRRWPGQPYGIMIIRVLAPALSHLRPGLRLAGPARPVIGLQQRRVARAPARGRRAAPRQSPTPAGMGRPRGPRRADPAPADTSTDAPAGRARHRPARAPPPDYPQVDLPAPDRAAACQHRDRRADRAARRREQRLGPLAGPSR